MADRFSKSTVEDAALAALAAPGWAVRHGLEIAPGELFVERKEYGDVALPEQFRRASQRLNPGLPGDAYDAAGAAMGGSFDGWHCWRFRSTKGNRVPLDYPRKGKAKPTY